MNLARPRAEEKDETGVQAHWYADFSAKSTIVASRTWSVNLRWPQNHHRFRKHQPRTVRLLYCGKAKTTTKRMTEVERIDVTEEKTNDVKSVMTRTRMRKQNTEDAACLPRVAILHDSVLNHVYARRLGLSYGCQVSKIPMLYHQLRR